VPYFLTQQLQHALSELRKEVVKSAIEEVQVFSSIQLLAESK
jgi:hypothetical protein